MFKHIAVSLCCGLLLSACGSPSSNSRITPQPSLANPNTLEVTLPSGGGYAFSATIDDSGTAMTNASILPGVVIRPAPIMGDGTYTGHFELEQITNISNGAGDTSSANGPLKLSVNFETGSVTTTEGALEVNGQISGNTLNGTVSYNGLEGDMQGNLGDRQIIGVFESTTSAENIYAGGFYGAR